MVMGPTHAMSGAALWLSAAAFGGGALAVAGADPAAIVLGTVVCAGAALAPDIDSHSSTIVNSLGVFGKALHSVVNAFSVAVYTMTSAKRDDARENGHRTLFHTPVMAILIGLLVSLGASIGGDVTILDKDFTWGQVFSLGVMGLFLHFGLAGLFEKQVKKYRKKYGPYVLMAVTALLTLGVALMLPEGDTYPWLGIAVAGGWLAHLGGDLITKMGLPVLWPIKIRGKRWYDVALPSFMRISANGVANTVLLYLFTAISVFMVFWLIPATHGFMVGLF